MNILFYSDNDEAKIIENGFREALPEARIDVFPDCANPAAIDYAVVWQPPESFFDELTNLRAIFSLGAGVDHLLLHPHLPADTPLVRLEDAGMGEKMAEYVLYGVLHAQRRFTDYARAQRERVWAHDAGTRHASDFRVGILGMGTLGQIVALRLLLNNFQVSGWSRRDKQIPDVTCHTGETGLTAMLADADVIVCLLPLTPTTEGLLNRSLFAKMKPGTFVINLARGRHLIAADLMDAIDSGHLAGALLDVTEPEPLPATHPLWRHPAVIITPHIAGPTQEAESINQVAANIRRHTAGESMRGLVDRDSGY